MDAMFYEILIRQAYECGRHGIYGADADIYRAFEMAVDLYSDEKQEKPKTFNKSVEELSYNAGFNTGIVTAHIKSAIYKVMRDREHDLNETQYQKLENCLMDLMLPDKHKINNVIKVSSDIFRDIGLLAQ